MSDVVGLAAAVAVVAASVACRDPPLDRDPLRTLHYVLWLLLNGGMWNSGDRILCGRFEIWGICGWWKFT